MPYKAFRVILFAVLIINTIAVSARNGEQQQLVEELQLLVDKSCLERAADRWLQQALEDLIVKYGSSWQTELLYEDFRDGDYSRNPRWRVLSGHFWVDRGKGLHSSVDAHYSDASSNWSNGNQSGKISTEEAIPGILIGALMGKDNQGDKAPEQPEKAQSDPSQPAVIKLQQNIPNAFALKITFQLQDTSDSARVEITLMQEEDGKYGYRLRAKRGARGFIELERVRNYRAGVVEGADLKLTINDGKQHRLQWQQNADGMVSVLLDNTKLFEPKDKAFRDDYRFLIVTNHSGDLAINSARISG